jgi:hypothetical protein
MRLDWPIPSPGHVGAEDPSESVHGEQIACLQQTGTCTYGLDNLCQFIFGDLARGC